MPNSQTVTNTKSRKSAIGILQLIKFFLGSFKELPSATINGAPDIAPDIAPNIALDIAKDIAPDIAIDSASDAFDSPAFRAKLKLDELECFF